MLFPLIVLTDRGTKTLTTCGALLKWAARYAHEMPTLWPWPKKGAEHAGIVFGAMHHFTIGDWIRYIRRLSATKSAEDVENLVFYVERW